MLSHELKSNSMDDNGQWIFRHNKKCPKCNLIFFKNDKFRSLDTVNQSMDVDINGVGI